MAAISPAVGIGVSLLLVTASAMAQTRTPQQPPPRPASAPPAAPVPRTLAQALAATYLYQPALQAARAQLRSVDEDVPQALAGWRPTVIVAGTAGYGDGMSRQFLGSIGGFQNLRTDRDIATAQTTVTQPLYTGGKVRANVNRASDLVMAQRANLMAQEETSFADAVNAYVGVIQARQTLALNINNENVLREQLQATNDQFRVGEVTRTDVAQAEAALAGAIAQVETSQGNVQTAGATYTQVIGYEPSPNLTEPQPLQLPTRTEQQAVIVAAANNPAVIAAEFNDAAAKNAIEAAFAALLPQVSFQGQVFQSNNSGARLDQTNGYTALLSVSVPLYQGGAEYSAVRQAKQTEQQQAQLIYDAQRTAAQNTVNAWETRIAAAAAAASTRTAIRANEIALVGVEREHLVGTRTTLDVLNAQQALLSSQVTLVQNLAQLVTASYALASAVGRLTARDLNLPVPYYDETAYYNQVKNKWAGIGVPRNETLFSRPAASSTPATSPGSRP
jgi:outer membrane protein